ncbi:hypothetical protein B0H14DRAFT_2609300 [Mycena olivaceomarginata]|nr:hypothetical protein B0H14DRAFT_2609300 [Mycena olivaceomarginata]
MSSSPPMQGRTRSTLAISARKGPALVELWSTDGLVCAQFESSQGLSRAAPNPQWGLLHEHKPGILSVELTSGVSSHPSAWRTKGGFVAGFVPPHRGIKHATKPAFEGRLLPPVCGKVKRDGCERYCKQVGIERRGERMCDVCGTSKHQDKWGVEVTIVMETEHVESRGQQHAESLVHCIRGPSLKWGVIKAKTAQACMFEAPRGLRQIDLLMRHSSVLGRDRRKAKNARRWRKRSRHRICDAIKMIGVLLSSHSVNSSLVIHLVCSEIQCWWSWIRSLQGSKVVLESPEVGRLTK